MPRIESIRPGGTLEASFAEYPLPELLVGILRGNLSGRLDVLLHPEPRNHVAFQDGVPVAVSLRDAGLSLVQLLVEDGELSREVAQELARVADAVGQSPSAVLKERRLVRESALDRAEQRLARLSLVRLFDAIPISFRFTEGAEVPRGVTLNVLQPLPLVFEGLMQAKDRRLVSAFLDGAGHRSFVLAPTYPQNVDPFQWGEAVEAVIGNLRTPATVEQLMARGLDRELILAALTSLKLVGMLEEVEAAERRPPPPRPSREQSRASDRGPEPRRAGQARIAMSEEPGGLVIHRSSGQPRHEPAPSGEVPVVPRPGVGGPSPSSSSSGPSVQPERHEQDFVRLRERLGPMMEQTYFQVLRVAPRADAPSVERAYRGLMKRVDEHDEGDVVKRAIREVLLEAFSVLEDPEQHERYAAAVERADAGRERKRLEAEPKLERTLLLIGEGRFAEAAFLLFWAAALDPSRSELPPLFAVLELARAAPEQRAQAAQAADAALGPALASQPGARILRFVQALLLAHQREGRSARRMFTELGEAEHPLAARALEWAR